MDSDDIFQFEDNRNQIELIKLRHPRTDKPSIYVYNAKKMITQEVLTFSQKYRSWFIGNSVKSDGTLYLSTTIDPLFLILPYLFKATVCSPLDQAIHDDDFPDTRKLMYTDAIKCISLIADEKDKKWNAWKYNEEKTLIWLKKKVISVAKVLKNKRINVNTMCAVSNTFIKINAYEENHVISDDILRYAHGIVSEYLPQKLSTSLLVFLGLPVDDISNEKKRKLKEVELLNIKQLKRESFETELITQLVIKDEKPEKVTRKSAKNTALQKAATGTKVLSSYFKKK